ncbi:MAG TPA: hypothetical protein VMJ33_09625 [Gallionella sp.]|nr:hypothetical protein [Gallionella sp.]
MQNLIYALIQVIHNFGAATVVGSAASALWLLRGDTGLVRGDAAVQRRLAILAAAAWAVQAASGALFGLTTYYFEHHLPDIHGIAVDALLVKIICAAAGFILAAAYVISGSRWAKHRRLLAWRVLLAIGAIALASAAFLRWFS